MLIVTGDFNASVVNSYSHRRLSSVKELLDEFELVCCDIGMSNFGYTYFIEMLKHETYIDHFFVYERLKRADV